MIAKNTDIKNIGDLVKNLDKIGDKVKFELVKQEDIIKNWYSRNKGSILKAAIIAYFAVEVTMLSFVGGYKLGKYITNNSKTKQFIQVEIGNQQFYMQK